MIINKRIDRDNTYNISIPLGYEYDSDSTSVVLLKGYLYRIMYDKTKTTDIVDLTLTHNYGEQMNESLS